jgi:cell division cycle 20-like protein 1 (cofactor of APC complex)
MGSGSLFGDDDAHSVGHASNSSGGNPSIVREFTAHRQEVCGLKWSFDDKMLASGGNDNKLFIWEAQQGRPTEPLCRFEDHTAAVKAVAWSPHQHGLVASGGGTADRHIRFWNANSNLPLHKIDTGSQV